MTRLALVIVGLLIAAAVAWDASERHYDACVNAAKARTPVKLGALHETLRTFEPRSGAKPKLGANVPDLTVVVDQRARERVVKGCSRTHSGHAARPESVSPRLGGLQTKAPPKRGVLRHELR